jgi:hypothetical protein
MAWAESLAQNLIFLKLKFLKAYDKVDWQFLFGSMVNFSLPEEFMDMTKLLFSDAEAEVKVNGFPSPSFKILRGVHQGCPLQPFIFLIVVEVLNTVVKKEVE